jgi:hypothetical protein
MCPLANASPITMVKDASSKGRIIQEAEHQRLFVGYTMDGDTLSRLNEKYFDFLPIFDFL